MRNRGVIDPITLYLIAGLAAGIFVGTYRPFAGFKKGPPTAELIQAQAALTAAQQQAKDAIVAKDAASVQERAKLESQIRSAQGDVLGVVESIRRVPVSHQTAETKLAGALAQRVDFKLGTAVGRLPEAERQVMLALIDQALSGKQVEIDEANRKLAERDAQFSIVTKERDEIKAQLPLLSKQAQEATQKAIAAQSQVTSLTSKVSEWANKTFAKDKENGSLGAALDKALFWLLVTGGVIVAWLTCAWWLPKMLDFLPSGKFKNLVRHTAGTISGGAWYIDAHQKLSATKLDPPSS